MANEPKLTVYEIRPKPTSQNIDRSNRTLFRHIIGKTNDEDIDDKVIFMDLFAAWIHAIDKPEMYSDKSSRKCMTANQADLGDDNVNANIIAYSDSFVIDGIVEGGPYGRNRKKTSTINKNQKDNVRPDDAITDDFYFFLYLPPVRNVIILMMQSYGLESIDSVMRTFCENFFSVKGVYWKPDIKSFTPDKIVDDFKEATAVSQLEYTGEVPGETLLQDTKTAKDKSYTIKITITPNESDFTMEEFEEAKKPLENSYLGLLKNLGIFHKKRGKLKDKTTGQETPFDLDGTEEIRPRINLGKYIPVLNSEYNVNDLRDFCFNLLEDIKKQVYQNAVTER